jgi:RNA 2',3'-cyclic 3'-phosphodiesterase
MRLFFAAWPPAETARALHRWAQAVQRDAGGRLTREENIHLTLAFLGEADPARSRAAAATVAASPHSLPLTRARYWRPSRILWVGPERTPAALEALAASLHAALAAEGFVLEERPFAAHVTLLRKARPPRSLPALPTLEWPVDEFALVRSATLPEGSRYETLERFPLQGAR